MTWLKSADPSACEKGCSAIALSLRIRLGFVSSCEWGAAPLLSPRSDPREGSWGGGPGNKARGV